MPNVTQRDADRAHLIGAGMPTDLAQIACSAPDDTDAIASLRGSLEAGSRFVVLTGSVGVGKSVAAATWLARKLDQHGRAWMGWVHAHQLARLSGFDSRREAEQLEQVDFLVLDDLGVEYLDGKGFLSALIDSVVYQRHGNRRLTVCTTNLTAGDFKARYGERVADRIRECGVFVEIAGKSLRKPSGTQPSTEAAT